VQCGGVESRVRERTCSGNRLPFPPWRPAQCRRARYAEYRPHNPTG